MSAVEAIPAEGELRYPIILRDRGYVGKTMDMRTWGRMWRRVCRDCARERYSHDGIFACSCHKCEQPGLNMQIPWNSRAISVYLTCG